MNCAFIGFGNAAFGLISGLRRAGMGDIFFHKHRETPPFTGRLAERVRVVEARFVPGYAQLAAASNTLLSCVVGSAALEVAELAACHLSSAHLYVDMNTASPAVKKQAANIVEASGARYVDASIMGPVEAMGHKVPITASGSGAEEFARLFTPFGMDIEVMPGEAGRAAAIKLLRSVFQKGMMCLFIEMYLAARVCDVEDMVISSVSRTFDGVGLRTMAERMVPKAISGSARMFTEMDDVHNALKSMGLPAFMSAGSAGCFAWCRDLDLAGLPYADLDNAINGVRDALHYSASAQDLRSQL